MEPSGSAGEPGPPRRESVPPPGASGHTYGKIGAPRRERPVGPAPQVRELRSLDSRRLAARLIDAALFLAPTALLGLEVSLTWAAWLISLWLAVAYFFLCEAIAGQTLGKRLMKLRVLSRDGSPPGVNAVAARNVVRIVEEPVIALLVLVGSGRRRQRVGDLIAGTTVGRAAGAAKPIHSRWIAAYPVAWAVAALLFGLLAQPTVLPGQPDLSAAGFPDDMTPEWAAFAGSVDQACAGNFNAGVLERQRISAEAQAEGWRRRATNTALLVSWAKAQDATHDAIAALGDPPTKRRLFQRWLANVGRRGEVMRRRARAFASGDKTRHLAADLRIQGLKVDADLMGVRFGLEVCISNGEVVRALQASAADPDAAHAAYVAAMNRTCKQRNRREEEQSASGALTTPETISLSLGETLQLSAIAPPPADYDLRARVLALKRDLDARSKELLRRVSESPRPGRMFATLSRRLGRHADRVQGKLQSLGFSNCGNWGPAPAPSLVAARGD